MTFNKNTSNASGASARQLEMQAEKARAFDPSKPAWTKGGWRITRIRWCDEQNPPFWAGVVEVPERGEVAMLWHDRNGVRTDDQLSLTNVDPASHAEKESDAAFVERMATRGGFDRSMKRSDEQRLVALSKEALRLKAVVDFCERKDRLACRSAAIPARAEEVERVARAIHFASDGFGSETAFASENDAHWEHWWNEDREHHERVARAALSAAPPLSDSEAYRVGQAAERERCAGIADSHQGRAKRDREARPHTYLGGSFNEVLAEERGEDIAAVEIAKTIRDEFIARRRATPNFRDQSSVSSADLFRLCNLAERGAKAFPQPAPIDAVAVAAKALRDFQFPPLRATGERLRMLLTQNQAEMLAEAVIAALKGGAR